MQSGGDLIAAAKRDRVFAEETPTDGYTLRLFTAYSFGGDRPTSTITARLDNSTNELYRNHLSLIQDFVAEMGRNFRIVYAISF